MTEELTFSPKLECRVALRATSGNARMSGRGSKASESTKGLQRSRSAVTKGSKTVKSEFGASHLENVSYQEYRSRKRQDRGKDGQPVWSTEMEISFQDALRFIPPIGKNQRSHGGKPNGRNELIAKWLEIDTGQVRDRKQISSHIQYLTKKFSRTLHTDTGETIKIVDPDWNALTKHNGNTIHDEDYYWESLEDKVRIVKQLRNQARLRQNHGFEWDQLRGECHSIRRIAFSMWVGHLPDMSQTLHDYTRISDQITSLPLLPLNAVKGWQTKFPDLETVLNGPNDEPFEIILFNSRVAPMIAFPPASAKLGLTFDVDFGQQDDRSISIYQSWCSTTYFYRNGQRLNNPKLGPCQLEQDGAVKPCFEAEWWAQEFTTLVQRRTDAEATKDPSLIAIADEQSKASFRRLTVMQEIYASPSEVQEPGSLRKRMAVLLWTFGQAHKGHTPLTTWCKLDHRQQAGTTNASHLNFLGSDVLDGHVDKVNAWSPSKVLNGAFAELQHGHDTSFSPSMFELDAFDTDLSCHHNPDIESSSLNGHAMFEFGPDEFGHPDSGMAAAPIDYPSLHYSVVPEPIPPALQLPSNDFSTTRNVASFSPSAAFKHCQPEGSPDRQRSLANFDVSTHAMLQAQLGPDEHDTSEHDSSLSRTAINKQLQYPGTDLIEDLTLNTQDAKDSAFDFAEDEMVMIEPYAEMDKVALEHPSIFETPKICRPPLLNHNSFAGVLPSQWTGADEVTLDTPMRLVFEQLINSHEQQACSQNPCDAFDAEVSHIHLQQGKDLTRPQSQPPASCNSDFDCQVVDLCTEDAVSMVDIKLKEA